jgi:hypothetical protein
MFGLEHCAQQLEVHLVVIDDKNAGRHAGGSSVDS